MSGGRGGGVGEGCDALAPRASLTARNVLSGGGKSVSCILGSLSSVCSHENLAHFIYLFTYFVYLIAQSLHS